MKNAKYYKILFLVAGIWNIGAAFPCWIGSVFMQEQAFKLFGMPTTVSLFPFHAMFWLIITFGVGYIIVSRNIEENRGIVIIGIIGKILYALDCIITVSLKEANLILLGTGLVDLIFVILFIDFLLKTRKNTVQTAN